jgi:hypothetical protein
LGIFGIRLGGLRILGEEEGIIFLGKRLFPSRQGGLGFRERGSKVLQRFLRFKTYPILQVWPRPKVGG